MISVGDAAVILGMFVCCNDIYSENWCFAYFCNVHKSKSSTCVFVSVCAAGSRGCYLMGECTMSTTTPKPRPGRDHCHPGTPVTFFSIVFSMLIHCLTHIRVSRLSEKLGWLELSKHLSDIIMWPNLQKANMLTSKVSKLIFGKSTANYSSWSMQNWLWMTLILFSFFIWIGENSQWNLKVLMVAK